MSVAAAVCPACRADMTEAFSCLLEQRPGVTFYGQDAPGADWYAALVEGLPARCRDCQVALGGVHHPGCCIAQCLTCDEQRLVCPCDDELMDRLNDEEGNEDG